MKNKIFNLTKMSVQVKNIEFIKLTFSSEENNVEVNVDAKSFSYGREMVCERGPFGKIKLIVFPKRR